MNNAVAGKLSIITAALSLTAAALTGCDGRPPEPLPRVDRYDINAAPAERKHLKVGVVPGPYGDMFMEAVFPILEKKGYTAELVYYDNYTLPNTSLANKQIDLNIFQHYLYLVNFKFENDASLSAIVEVPTASMGIFSKRHKSVNNLPYGATVALPNDNTNSARALMVLEDAGVIKLDPNIDKTKSTTRDVAYNPRGIKFVHYDAHTLVRNLPNYDIAVINGNFALSGGLDLADALYNERLGGYYFNVIAVRTEDLGERFVEDIVTAMRTDEYRAVITDPNRKFAEFQRPLNFNVRAE